MKNMKMNVKVVFVASKVKFRSKSFYNNFVEETEDGKLIEHVRYEVDNGWIEAEILETRKYTYKLQLPDGNVIVKKHKQVELI